MPIIDFHCHLNPEEIYENKNYPNITRIWINEDHYGDHYKWRLMRANGVPEELITGDGDEYEKFMAWLVRLKKQLVTHCMNGLTLNYAVSLALTKRSIAKLLLLFGRKLTKCSKRTLSSHVI